MSTDTDLLEAWRAGDRGAGDQLFGRYFDQIYRFFCRKADGDDVEELIQRTFVACVEARDRFRSDSSFRTYLFAIARNQLLVYWRGKSRAAALDFGVSSLHDLGPSPPSELAGREEQRLLLEALRRIPVDLQIAIELHYWEGMSGPELAEVLDIPEGTVRSRLRRAREALLARLEELAGSARLLESTVSDLESWALSLKRDLARTAS